MSNCIYSYLECVLKYMEDLAPRNLMGEIWENSHKVSFADF